MLKSIGSILFYAGDLEKTASFYGELGFSVEKSGDMVYAKLGIYTLEFVDKNKAMLKKEAQAEPKGLGVFVCVEVEDVDVYFENLVKKGIRTSSQPRDWPWGQREFAVKDPDGYKLVFYSPVKK